MYIVSVGDALCTIAAASSFPEPFVTPRYHKRLSWAHRSFAGDRFSDHVALLTAYQNWERMRQRGEEAEQRYCDNKSLNLLTLRMTHDAKTQLCNILTSAGFPEYCVEYITFSNTGEDTNLDL
uniref:Uncharacterized protein n=1 Tax=Romanomermis culicivorax TaxID=13658 RepID=A0A915I3D7_ROMCU